MTPPSNKKPAKPYQWTDKRLALLGLSLTVSLTVVLYLTTISIKWILIM